MVRTVRWSIYSIVKYPHALKSTSSFSLSSRHHGLPESIWHENCLRRRKWGHSSGCWFRRLDEVCWSDPLPNMLVLMSRKHGEFYYRCVLLLVTILLKTKWTGFEGYPGCEFQIRDALAFVIGQEKSEFFFDKVRTGSYDCIYLKLNHVYQVSWIFLHGQGRFLFQKSWSELSPSSLQLPPLWRYQSVWTPKSCWLFIFEWQMTWTLEPWNPPDSNTWIGWSICVQSTEYTPFSISTRP
jgi:hypothetical protein